MRETPPLTSAFAFAYEGVLRTLAGERNMKIHWVSGLAVMMVGMALPLSLSTRASLLFAVILVVATETLNAAVEGVVDLVTETWAYEAKLAKDAAAGTVLLVSGGAVLLLADVLHHQWSLVLVSGGAVQRTVVFGVPTLTMLGAGLLAESRVWARAAFGMAGIGLAPLVWLSEDAVFSAMAILIVLVAADARRRRAELLDRAPPAPSSPTDSEHH